LLGRLERFSSPIAIPKSDYKFYNNSHFVSNNVWYRYSNEPLKNILKAQFIVSLIATSEGDPRPLIMAIDV